MPTSPVPPLVSLAQLGDMAIQADSEIGYMRHTGSAEVIGTLKVALFKLQRIYEADRATAQERIANLEAQLRVAETGLARLMADAEASDELLDMYEKGWQMSDAKQWTDGHYRFDDGEGSFIAYVHHGVVGDDPIEWFLTEDGVYGEHTITPVHVLSEAEYDDLAAQIAALEIDNARLRETLAFAAQYKGFEGRACPLCTYENGKFVKRCQMHTDMDALRAELEEARAWEAVRDVKCDCNDGKCTKRVVLEEGFNGSRCLLWFEDSMMYLPVGDWRLQRRAPSAGEVVDGE